MNRREILGAALAAPFLAKSGFVLADEEGGWDFGEQATGYKNNAATEWVVPEREGSGFWSRPRYIDLQRPDTNERFGIVYHRNGRIDEVGYRKACEVLQDRHAQLIYPMDVRLLDLICATQAWLRFHGYNVPYLVHSAYRSPKTNSKIEGAALNSRHMEGTALDFSVPGVPASYMGVLAQKYIRTDAAGGGVGFYPGQEFTHMDTGRGRERVWVGHNKKR